MKIVVAPDSFKGSITSLEAAKIMEQAIFEIDNTIKVSLKPMADGGEGTLAAILNETSCEEIPIRCTGPLGEQINTVYGMMESGTAVIEAASIAGLEKVSQEKLNPNNTTTYGIGEVITDALNRGCTSAIIGIGGSASNDGGMGMLQALGMKVYDGDGKALSIFGRDFIHMQQIDISEMDTRLAQMKLEIASDVDNPLCGDNGATAVYGPQKGVTPSQIWQYDHALDVYSKQLEGILGKSFKHKAGAGAAGGLGFAFLVLGAQLTSGAKLIANINGVENEIESADLVITGEGQSDEQTLYGKAPSYIAELANKYDVPVVLLSGSISGDTTELRKTFTGCFSIVSQPLSLKQCMENVECLLLEQTRQIVQLVDRVRNTN